MVNRRLNHCVDYHDGPSCDHRAIETYFDVAHIDLETDSGDNREGKETSPDDNHPGPFDDRHGLCLRQHQCIYQYCDCGGYCPGTSIFGDRLFLFHDYVGV